MQQKLQVGAVGIDFGSNRSVIAVAKKKGVDVITNQASQRETPNIVGYGDKERYLGEQGLVRAKSNFKNTCAFSNRLIGLTSTYPKLKEETKWITSKVVTNDETGEIKYDVASRGDRAQLTPVQVTASMIGELRKIVALNDVDNKEAVLSVPAYFTEKERKALLDAAKIAHLKVTRIISESSAVTLSYGLFRKTDLPEKSKEARNVIFVDLGHSKLSCFVSSFTKEKAQVLLQETDRHLGSRDFDWTLLKFYDEMFQKKSGLSIFESKKAILRALDAIQKQRKILSANSHAAISAECLVEDEDLSHDLSREDFEKLIQPDLERIKVHLQNLKQSIDLKGIKIHSVEIVGGASRTPAVQQLIEQTFKQEVFRTLNQSECIARGCAMMAAYISPQFRVIEYQLEECNVNPIKVSWNFLNNGGVVEEGKTATFFDRGCSIPNIKSLTFQRADGISLDVFYSPAPEGFQAQIQQMTIPALSPKEKDFSIKIRVKLNPNGIVELTESLLIEKYKVEEKVKIEKPKDEKKEGDKKDEKKEGEADKKEEDEYEIKVKDKQRQSEISVKTTHYYEFTQEQIDAQYNYEQEMVTNDRIILETNAKKNELETFCYEWKDRLSGKYAEFAEAAVIPEIIKKLEEDQAWLEDDGEHASKSQYVARIEDVQKLTNPIQNRFREFEQLPDSYTNIDKCCFQAEQFVSSTDPKFAHITAEERAPIAQESEKIRKIISEGQAKIQAAPKNVDPALTVAQITELGANLIKLSQPIMGKPVPKPKEEEKKDEKKEEGDKKEENGDKKEENENKQEQQQQDDNKMEEEPSK